MKETWDVLKSIFSNANYFINWFVLLTLIIILIFSIIIFALYKFKNKHISMLMSIVLGLVLLLILYLVKSNTTVNGEVIDFTKNLLHIPGMIFIDLVMIAIPIFLILVVSGLVFNSNFNEVKKSTYGISFAALFGLSIFGILIALLLSPLILLIPNNIWPVDDSTIIGGSEEGFEYAWVIVLGLIWLTFIVSLIMKYTMKNYLESFAKFTDAGVKGFSIYFKYLVTSIPFILLLRIGSLGISESPKDSISFLLIFLAIFWLGTIIINTILIAINLMLADKKLSIKEKLKIMGKQWLIVFGVQSMSASLPYTMDTAQELGVCKEITEITPKKGIFMGMVMCNGFTPMIMVLFTLIFEDAFTFMNVFAALLIILTLAFSTSGAGSADYIITMTTLSTIGIPSHLYFNHLLWASEINEFTISKPTNNLGHITATLITEKHHIKNKECCEHGCNHNHTAEEEIKTS